MHAHVAHSARVAEIPLTRQSPALVLFGLGAGGKPRAAWFEAADTEAATAAAEAMQLRVLPLSTREQREVAGQLTRGRMLPSGRAHVPFAKHDLYARLIALAGEEAVAQVSADGRSKTVADAPDASDAESVKDATEASVAAAEPSPVAAADPRELASDVGSRDRGAAAEPATVGASAEQSKPLRPGDRTFVGEPKPRDHAEIGLGSVVLAHEGHEEGWWEAEVIGINGRVFSLRWRDYPTQPAILRKAGELALLPPGEA